MNPETKQCQNCKNNFIIEEEDFVFYDRVKVPPPTFCPDCRMFRRIASRNQRSLFKRDCSKCGKDMPSMYSPDSLFTVYCTECYFKDDWDASEYSADYDFSKPFFIQFYELLKQVPQLHIAHTNNNGGGIVFSNYVYRSNNIYLSYGVVRSENIYYSWGSENNNKTCVDCANFTENEKCYELVAAKNNYASSFLTRSHRCLESHFLFDCFNCTNCFMSSNLRNKSYVFRNEQLTQDTYKEKIVEAMDGTYEKQENLQNEYENLMRNSIHRYASIIQSTNCIGDSIFNSKNIYKSFSIENSENVRYSQITTNSVANCFDFSMSGRAENSYEFSVAGRGNENTLFCFDVGDTQNIQYCDGVNHVKNLFGCIGLKHKQFSILNKQYSETEYKELVPKIIEQMNATPYIDSARRIYKYGEYFPIELSRFPYNQTNLFELYPLSKEVAMSSGYIWVDMPKREHKATVSFDKLPRIISEDVAFYTKNIYPCLHNEKCNHICSGAFRVTPDEVNLYKKLGIALPRLCPNCRYFKRLERILPWKLWSRTCMCDLSNHAHVGKCQAEFETSYSPDRPEKVFCEKCYQQEVV
jgi:hypothetical protein